MDWSSQRVKREFAGGPKFLKMILQDNMSSYYISMGKVLDQEGFDLGLVSAQNEGVNYYIYFWTPLMSLDLVQIPS